MSHFLWALFTRKSLLPWSREVDKDLITPPVGFRNWSKVWPCGSPTPFFQHKEEEAVEGSYYFYFSSIAQMHSWVSKSLESLGCLVIAPLAFSLKTDADGPCMFLSVSTWAGDASILPCFSWLFPQYSTSYMVTSLLRHPLTPEMTWVSFKEESCPVVSQGSKEKIS